MTQPVGQCALRVWKEQLGLSQGSSSGIQEVEEPTALSTCLHASRSPQDSLEAVLATIIRDHECLLGNSTQSTGVQISSTPIESWQPCTL